MLTKSLLAFPKKLASLRRWRSAPFLVTTWIISDIYRSSKCKSWPCTQCFFQTNKASYCKARTLLFRGLYTISRRLIMDFTMISNRWNKLLHKGEQDKLNPTNNNWNLSGYSAQRSLLLRSCPYQSQISLLSVHPRLRPRPRLYVFPNARRWEEKTNKLLVTNTQSGREELLSPRTSVLVHALCSLDPPSLSLVQTVYGL